MGRRISSSRWRWLVISSTKTSHSYVSFSQWLHRLYHSLPHAIGPEGMLTSWTDLYFSYIKDIKIELHLTEYIPLGQLDKDGHNKLCL